jgi:PKD repeat protein
VDYTFEFGDGTGAVGPQPDATATHTYSSPGTYTVTTTATDTADNTSKATTQVTAYPNLAANPGFETDTQGWNTGASSAGVALTRAAAGHSGTGAALLTNAGTTAATCTLNDSPNIVRRTTTGTYTATLWARADTSGATLKLRLREWSGNTAVGQAKTAMTLTSQWQPVTVEYTPLDPDVSTLDLSAYVMNAPPGACFEADDVSVYEVPVTFGPGGFVLGAGAVATFSDPTFSACNSLSWGYTVNGVDQGPQGSKGSGCLSVSTASPVTAGPFATPARVTVYLADNTCGDRYYSDSTPVDHVIASGTNPYYLRFADAGGYCERATTTTNTFSGSNFAVTVNITANP